MKVKKPLLKKALAKGKATLSKGQKAAASSSKGTLPKGKRATLSEGKKATLSKGKKLPCQKVNSPGNLKGLGKLSLQEKVEKIAEETDTAEEAALVLKENINQNERGKIWAKHQAALKHDPEAEAQHQVANKTQKGLASLLWFIQNKSAKYLNVKATFGTTETLTKG